MKDYKLELFFSIVGFFALLGTSTYFLITALYTTGGEKLYLLFFSGVCFLITFILLVSSIRLVVIERKRKSMSKYKRYYDFKD